MSKNSNDDLFVNTYIDSAKLNNKPEYDLPGLYQQSTAELALQQSKRDQIISLYLAIFSFLIPFSLSMDSLNLQFKGMIFLSVGLIGILFSLIIVRYKVYKDVYWMCCKTFTVLYNFKQDELDKQTVQAVFYKVLQKSGKKYIVDTPKGKKISNSLFVKKNIFSAETMHYLIQVIITSIIIGLGFALIVPMSGLINLLIGIAAGTVIFIILLCVYFSKFKAIFKVLVNNKNSSFNYAFSKAWFLHFYMD